MAKPLPEMIDISDRIRQAAVDKDQDDQGDAGDNAEYVRERYHGATSLIPTFDRRTVAPELPMERASSSPHPSIEGPL